MSEFRDEFTREGPRAASGAGVVSWLLLLLGLTGFVPSVVVPEWLAYCRMVQAEREERLRLLDLEQRVRRESHALQALQTDPEVVARLAQRELNFTREGSVVVPIAPPEETGFPLVARFVPARAADAEPAHPDFASVAPDAPPLPQLPPVLRRLVSWLPDVQYERVFCDPICRSVLMGMSVALFAVAIWMVRRPAPLAGPRNE